jgi:hypothetical protein
MRPDIEDVVRFGDLFRPTEKGPLPVVMFVGWSDTQMKVGGRVWYGMSMERTTIAEYRGLLSAFGNGPHEGEPFWVQVEPE